MDEDDYKDAIVDLFFHSRYSESVVMDKYQAKDLIVETLNDPDVVGDTGMVQALSLISHPKLHPVILSDNYLPDLLEELVQEGRIREEEYTDPGMEWRIKSRYGPKRSD